MLKLEVASQHLNPRLRSADPELPTIATRAAVELDYLRRGKDSEFHSVIRLGQLLRNTLEKPEGSALGHVSCLMDPSTIVLVARALYQAGENPGPTTREVCELTESIANKLEQAAAKGDRSSAKELQHFCVELARGVASRKQIYRSDPSSQPFRR